MDILGKTGREYAWIGPDDRIYTASQSAGILKSNKIPGLEGLAKGINNFIPGYEKGADWNNSGSGGGGSSSRGGSGGGGKGDKDPRYDPNTLKIRDILERYYTILQQLDDITKAVEHIGKAIDRGWGQERIKNLERQEKLLESQYKMQEAYVKEIKDYLNHTISLLLLVIDLRYLYTFEYLLIALGIYIALLYFVHLHQHFYYTHRQVSKQCLYNLLIRHSHHI